MCATINLGRETQTQNSSNIRPIDATFINQLGGWECGGGHAYLSKKEVRADGGYSEAENDSSHECNSRLALIDTVLDN